LIEYNNKLLDGLGVGEVRVDWRFIEICNLRERERERWIVGIGFGIGIGIGEICYMIDGIEM